MACSSSVCHWIAAQAFIDVGAKAEEQLQPFAKELHKLAAKVRETSRAQVASGKRKKGQASSSSSSRSALPLKVPAVGELTSSQVKQLAPGPTWRVSNDDVNERWLLRQPGNN